MKTIDINALGAVSGGSYVQRNLDGTETVKPYGPLVGPFPLRVGPVPVNPGVTPPTPSPVHEESDANDDGIDDRLQGPAIEFAF